MAKNRVKAVPKNPKVILLEGSFASVAAEQDFIRAMSNYGLASLRRSSGKGALKKVAQAFNRFQKRQLSKAVQP